MRILVANNAAPFIRGGAELLADRLVAELRKAGHDAELLRIPLGSTPEQIVDSMAAATLLDVPNTDRIVGLKFPAYLIPHDDVVTWLVHPFRQAYEPPPVGWPADPRLTPIVEAVRAADMRAFTAAKRLYCISPVIAGRLEEHTGLRAEVLMTPPHTDQEYRTSAPQDYLVALGRVSSSKRQALAIRAMAHARPGYRLVVAGAPEDEATMRDIERDIADLGLEDRVQLIPRFISEEEKLELLEHCAASVYLPIEEDSYGYVCYEAAMSRKPSITGTDSGGTHTLVDDGRTGLVVEPEPQALARAFDALALDRDRARDMGEKAHELALELDLSWTRVIEELTR